MQHAMCLYRKIGEPTVSWLPELFRLLRRGDEEADLVPAALSLLAAAGFMVASMVDMLRSLAVVGVGAEAAAFGEVRKMRDPRQVLETAQRADNPCGGRVGWGRWDLGLAPPPPSRQTQGCKI